MGEAKIRLAEAVQQLRKEMMEASKAGEGEALRFDVQEVELEAQVEVTTSGEGTAGVSFWVVNAEAGGKREVGHLHKVTLKLRPGMTSGVGFKLGRDT